MTNALASPQLDMVLRRLFAAAAKDDEISAPTLPPGRSSWAEATAAELSDARENYYIPISAEAGNLLYALTRAIRPATAVEFGTSYGISTLYLAAGVTDNGTGQVFTTELSKKKVAAARANLDEAGVGNAVTILSGDALETLVDVPGTHPARPARRLEGPVPAGAAPARAQARARRTRCRRRHHAHDHGGLPGICPRPGQRLRQCRVSRRRRHGDQLVDGSVIRPSSSLRGGNG